VGPDLSHEAEKLMGREIAESGWAMKSQYPNPKFQIISNHQMTKFQNKPVSVIRNWNLDIVWDLACLREAAPACAKPVLRRA
jgi:hypothetical protein